MIMSTLLVVQPSPTSLLSSSIPSPPQSSTSLSTAPSSFVYTMPSSSKSSEDKAETDCALAMLASTNHSTSPPPAASSHHILKRESHIVRQKTLSTKVRKPNSDTTTTTTKRVRFHPVVSIQRAKSSTSSTSSSISQEELRNQQWYTQVELRTMKEMAVQLVLYTTSTFGSHHLPRGLEGYAQERMKYKVNATKCIIVADRKRKIKMANAAPGAAAAAAGGQARHDEVAELSCKLSKWNVDVAFARACKDYFELYHPSLVTSIPPVGPAPKIALVPKKHQQQNMIKRRRMDTDAATGMMEGASVSSLSSSPPSSRKVRRRIEGPPSA